MIHSFRSLDIKVQVSHILVVTPLANKDHIHIQAHIKIVIRFNSSSKVIRDSHSNLNTLTDNKICKILCHKKIRQHQMQIF